jgi:hypothetical protein
MVDPRLVKSAQHRLGLGISAVVLNHNLDLVAGLSGRRCQRMAQRVGALQCGNDDRESRHRGGWVTMFKAGSDIAAGGRGLLRVLLCPDARRGGDQTASGRRPVDGEHHRARHADVGRHHRNVLLCCGR